MRHLTMRKGQQQPDQILSCHLKENLQTKLCNHSYGQYMTPHSIVQKQLVAPRAIFNVVALKLDNPKSP
jgi:hypothetical protein